MFVLTVRTKPTTGDLLASTLRLKYRHEEALRMELCHRVVADLPDPPLVSPCRPTNPNLLQDLRQLVSQAPSRRFSLTNQTYTSDQIKMSWKAAERI